MPILHMLLVLLLAATPVAATPAAKSAPPAQLTPAMWELSDDDTRITLFGTVHALPRDVDWFRPHVVAALDSADRLVLEAMQPEDATTFTASIRQMARLRAPLPLVARVPAAHRPALQAAVARLRPPPLDGYKNWYVALTLANLQAAANGFEPRIGVEAVLMERARLKDIPVSGLETMEQQLVYFDALTPADQAQILITTIEDLPDSKADTEALLRSWLDGDLEEMRQLMDQGFRRSPMLKQMMVDDRNKRWAHWIAQQMRETPGHIFVAVGAGHFTGPGNLLEALKKYGFEATRLSPPPAIQGRGKRP